MTTPRVELLAPAGNRDKLNTALHFGADAVYLAGTAFGLRAYADNFDDEALFDAVSYAHSLGKKVYVAVNVYANQMDFLTLGDYLRHLVECKVDAIIASDLGVIAYCRRVAPTLAIHVSTQANVMNAYAAEEFVKLGAERIVLARELTLVEIAEIKKSLPVHVELESFVHGAMCVSYSGRCLLSNFLAARSGNRGECVQACRWEYTLVERSRRSGELIMSEDSRGTYVMNSRDLNMLEHLDDLIDAGVTSFKIEGRMKSQYYVANTVNAYRRAIDGLLATGNMNAARVLAPEMLKAANRLYTTGFYYGKQTDTINLDNNSGECVSDFIAEVVEYDEARGVVVEQRNRFREGDVLEILSSTDSFNRRLTIHNMTDVDGNPVADAKLVQQILYIPCEHRLSKHDILRSVKVDES